MVTYITKKCEKCGNDWDFPVLIEIKGIKHTRHVCDPCYQKQQEDDLARKMAVQESDLKAYSKQWEIICPPIYQETDEIRLPIQFSDVMAWEYSPIGLGLVGSTGKGKTRCAWKLIEKLYAEKKFSVLGMSSTNFAHKCGALFSDNMKKAVEWIDDLCEVNVLFLDDIGKERFTERVTTELYHVIETRTSNKLPIIWTSNLMGDEFKNKLGESGDAIVRRLREFSKIVSFV